MLLKIIKMEIKNQITMEITIAIIAIPLLLTVILGAVPILKAVGKVILLVGQGILLTAILGVIAAITIILLVMHPIRMVIRKVKKLLVQQR